MAKKQKKTKEAMKNPKSDVEQVEAKVETNYCQRCSNRLHGAKEIAESKQGFCTFHKKFVARKHTCDNWSK